MLLARFAAMYALVLCVSQVVRFERTRRQAAVEREDELQRERIELSQTIHDTATQTAFMIGLGIDAAKQVVGDSNEEIAARLDVTSQLSKTAVWQLRHPIDMGRIFEGSELGWTLNSHVATFRTITSVSDDGVGLPDRYEGRGHGFANMRAYARRLGGRLIIEPKRGRVRLRHLRDTIGSGRTGGIDCLRSLVA